MPTFYESIYLILSAALLGLYGVLVLLSTRQLNAAIAALSLQKPDFIIGLRGKKGKSYISSRKEGDKEIYSFMFDVINVKPVVLPLNRINVAILFKENIVDFNDKLNMYVRHGLIKTQLETWQLPTRYGLIVNSLGITTVEPYAGITVLCELSGCKYDNIGEINTVVGMPPGKEDEEGRSENEHIYDGGWQYEMKMDFALYNKQYAEKMGRLVGEAQKVQVQIL